MIEDAYSGELSLSDTDLTGLIIDIGSEFVGPLTSEKTDSRRQY